MSDDHVDDGDDFEAMLEASFAAQRPLPSVGERVKAVVVQVGADNLLLELDGGHDGIMSVRELLGDESLPDPKVGDEVEAYVLRVRNRVAELGLELGRVAGGAARLEEARDSGLPVKGTVREVNKGGFVVDIGGTRAFCPLGAMDTRRIDDPAGYVGQALHFRVTELRGPRDVVVSRRALLEEERERLAAETRKVLQEGARLRGTVREVREFGAFVDLGGIDGLIPARELAYGRRRPDEVVSPGETVAVEVMRIETDDRGRERVTLSRRALEQDPFDLVAPSLTPGTVLAGRVTRLEPFGAFVELVPGVEGLVHVSAFGRRIGQPAEVVELGQDVTVRVDSLDAEARRIGLRYLEPDELTGGELAGPYGLRVRRVAGPAPGSESDVRPGETGPPAPADVAAPPRVGDVREVTVQRVARFGVFVTWDGHRGLIPGRELGLPRDADPRRQFPVGTTLEALIVEVRDDGKVTLSHVGVERARERADAEAYRREQRQPDSGLGTLADRLKGDRRR